ncbi:hypothetical protein D3C72_1531030 [compost metagenome]
MVAAQGFERLRQQMRDRAGRRAQAHPARQPLHLTLHIVQGLIGFGKQPAGAFQQGVSDGGGPDLAALARQQGRAHAGLQIRHVQADGGRRQMQRARGIRERSQVGDGHQGAQPVQTDFSHGCSRVGSRRAAGTRARLACRSCHSGNLN